MASLAKIRKQLAELRLVVRTLGTRPDSVFARYKDDPVGFCRDILGEELTPDQRKVPLALLKPPYRVLGKAGHGVGKSHASACTAVWWFMTRSPSIVITTAPKMDQVKTILWKEIRKLCRKANLPIPLAPRSPEAYRSANDFMVGTTSATGTAFQGQHDASLLFVFDEATGVASEIWEATETMFAGEGHGWLCVFNPTDTTAEVYRKERQAGAGPDKSWHVETLSVLNHPNITAEWRGEPAPVPHATRLARLDAMLLDWCERVSGDPSPGDIAWPPEGVPLGEGNPLGYKERIYLRPGPLAECRLLGKYPSQGTFSVWGDGDWSLACREHVEPLPRPEDVLPVIGCDPAWYGSDFTAIHVRCGGCSLYHERANGWSVTRIVQRLDELAKFYANYYNTKLRSNASKVDTIDKYQVPVKIDSPGGPSGGGVIDGCRAKGLLVLEVNAAGQAYDSEDFRNRRSELWFTVARRAKEGRLDFSALARLHGGQALEYLREQALAVRWSTNLQGQMEVEPKDVYRKRMGYSPDDMDAVNLAYAPGGRSESPAASGAKAGLPTGSRLD